MVKGRLDRRDDVPKLIAMELTLPDLSEGPRGPVVISLPVVRCTPPVVERLKEVLATHPGATEVHLRLQAASRTTVLRIGGRRPTSTSPTPTTPRVAPTSASVSRPCATSARTWWPSREREAKGRFTDFYDFLRKIDPVACNKKTVESLIKAGAFDSLGDPRRGLLNVHAEAIDSFMLTKRNEAHGQFDLFGGGGGDDDAGESEITVTPPVPLGEWDKSVLLQYEREMLGLYVSDHPLFGVEHVLSAAADCSIASLTGSEERADGSQVTIGGLVSGLQRKVTKKGDVWAIATVEDLEGAIEVMFFPQTYNLYATTLAEDAVVVVNGRLDRRDDVPKLIAMEMTAARPVRGTAWAGRHLAACRAVHAAGRRAPQGRPRHPPRRDRGAPAAAGGFAHHRAAHRRRAACQPHARPDG